ncbi:MAG: copper chaperone PCu(A)C [Hyphomicrobiaceae bacterium]|nr:copper chaperone PCu(A)C [Hyphomicrobiaceae bacterium]
MKSKLALAAIGLFLSVMPAFAQSTTENGITVICPWTQDTREGVEIAAVYFDVRVDRTASRNLTGARTELANDAQLSLFRRVGGVLRRESVPLIGIPAGRTVRLVPGGYHVLLTGLGEPLVVGGTFNLFLEFDGEGGFEVPVQVVPAGTGRPCGGPPSQADVPYRGPGYVPGPRWVPRGSYWWR